SGDLLGRRSLCLLALLLAKQADHFTVEDWNVGGLAAAHPILVADHFFVHPIAAGITDIVFNRVIAGKRSSIHQSCRYEKPRSVTDDSYWLPAVVHIPNEFLRRILDAQCVGIERASGKKHSVELLRIGFVQDHVDIELICQLIVLHALDLAWLYRNQRSARPSLVQGLPRFCQFRLLHSVCSQYCHTHPVQLLFCHIVGLPLKIFRNFATASFAVGLLNRTYPLWGTLPSKVL